MQQKECSRPRVLAIIAAAFTILQYANAGEREPLVRVATIELKGKPGTLDHVGADWTTSRLFVANEINDTLDVVNLKTNKLAKQVASQKEIHSIAYSPDSKRIFVGSGGGACNVLDGTDYTLLKSIPVPDADSVRFDPRTQHVFVAGENQIAVIDSKSLDLLATVKLPAPPHGFQVARLSHRVYVNVGVPCQVAVIDTEKNELVARYPLDADKGIGPLALDEPGHRLLVGTRRNPRLAVLDQDTGKEIASVPIPEGSDDMFWDAESKRIYISCSSGFVAVIRQIDRDHYESVANIATVKGAKTSAYDPTAKRLYVAVPRQMGKEAPEVWVFEPRSDRKSP